MLAAEAPKLSPRGEGGINYQVGRVGRDVFVRIEKNHGGGSFSKEWVPVEKIRAAITPEMKSGWPFRSDALTPAYVGRSQCNSGFLVAAMRHIGVFARTRSARGCQSSRATSTLGRCGCARPSRYWAMTASRSR